MANRTVAPAPGQRIRRPPANEDSSANIRQCGGLAKRLTGAAAFRLEWRRSFGCDHQEEVHTKNLLLVFG